VSSVRTQFFKTSTKAYRAVAKRRGAYAAMIMHGSAPSEEIKNPCQTKAWRSQDVPKAFSGLSLGSFLCVLRALCANPVFQDAYKTVSRRREKKGRLRRDNPRSLAFPGRSQGILRAFSRIFSLCSPCPLCEPCFSRHLQNSIAPSRKEGALTPR